MNILRTSAKLEAVFLNRPFKLHKDSITSLGSLFEKLYVDLSGLRETSGGSKSGLHNKDWQSSLHVSLWSQFIAFTESQNGRD